MDFVIFSVQHIYKKPNTFTVKRLTALRTSTKISEDIFQLDISGVKQIFDISSGTSYRFIWFLIILLSTVICAYQITQQYLMFLSIPIVTKFNLLKNDSVKFPAVTVCPSGGGEYSREKVAQEKNISDLCQVGPYHLVSKDLNSSDIWEKLSSEEMFDVVMMNTEHGAKHDNHVVKHFTSDNLLGKCHTFFMPGLTSFQKRESMLVLSYNNIFYKHCSSHLSFMYFFHHLEDDVTYKLKQDHFNLDVNSSIIIGITAKQFHFLNNTHYPCDSIQKVSRCHKLCFEDILTKRIDCSLPFMENDLPLCKDTQSVNHVITETNLIASDLDYDQNCTCPTVCDEIMYNYKFENNIGGSGLMFYFDSNNIEEFRQYYSYTLVAFICDMGGNMGLFLGVCIPTLCEILTVMFVYGIKTFPRKE